MRLSELKNAGRTPSTASGSPALTSCPTATEIALTRPGIGQSSTLPVSAATFSGISAASSASRCV